MKELEGPLQSSPLHSEMGALVMEWGSLGRAFVHYYSLINVCFKDFIYLLFLERGEWKEKGRETSVCERLVASYMPPTGDLAHNTGMCPDWEPNRRAFGSQAGAQSTEPYQG